MSPEFSKLVKQWRSTLQRPSILEKEFLKFLEQQPPLAGQTTRGQAAILKFPPDLSNDKSLDIKWPEREEFDYSGSGSKKSFEKFKASIAGIASGSSGSQERSLVILEDLGFEWIDVLATKLDVPLHVFAQHWASPIDHIKGRVRIPLGQDPHYHLVLNYDQLHPVIFDDKIDKGLSSSRFGLKIVVIVESRLI
jgi:hypothetical protein